jgi:acid phosphatase type 7
VIRQRLLAACAATAAIIAIGLPVSVVAAGDPVLVGAGDIAACDSSGDSATAALLANIAGTVFTAGDNAYPSGSLANYRSCYDATWGAAFGRTRPSLGNHEYGTSGAAGYFGYFGARGGPAGKGYYAYNLGTWRIYVLNSNCSKVGGCGARSPQVRWLRSDLTAHPRRCILAYWHHPLFSSGFHGNSSSVRPFWEALYAARADVVINGHDHDYERFSRQAPNGSRTTHGIVEFVAGTGGGERRPFETIRAHSVARNATTFGVLKLTLHATSFDWQFVPEAGKSFTDAGAGKACTHRA